MVPSKSVSRKQMHLQVFVQDTVRLAPPPLTAFCMGWGEVWSSCSSKGQLRSQLKDCPECLVLRHLSHSFLSKWLSELICLVTSIFRQYAHSTLP